MEEGGVFSTILLTRLQIAGGEVSCVHPLTYSVLNCGNYANLFCVNVCSVQSHICLHNFVHTVLVHIHVEDTSF